MVLMNVVEFIIVSWLDREFSGDGNHFILMILKSSQDHSGDMVRSILLQVTGGRQMGQGGSSTKLSRCTLDP